MIVSNGWTVVYRHRYVGSNDEYAGGAAKTSSFRVQMLSRQDMYSMGF